MTGFEIPFSWRARPKPHMPPEDFLAGVPLLRASLIRFNHVYRGGFKIPLTGGELALLFEDDLAIVFDALPGWLARLASPKEGSEPLLFGSQGTELVLTAQRIGEAIVVSAHSIDPEHPMEAIFQPLTTDAHTFLRAWVTFLSAVLTALADFEPRLCADSGWLDYRTALRALPS